MEGALGALTTADANKLPKSGGTMSGAINMGANKITNVLDGTAGSDAVNVNQLNDQISRNTAFYRGSFATHAALVAVAWQTSDPTAANYVTNNDYAYVEDDETHNDEAWRYSYVYETGGQNNGWTAQFRVNESPLTSAQVEALNSGATSTNIAQISTNASAISGIKNGTNINSFGGVETALAGKSNTSSAFTVTLTTAGWSGTAQTVSNANFVANGYGYIVTPMAGSAIDYADAAIYADDVTTDGQMTFHCLGVPSVALNVNILRVEVT